MTGWTKKLMGTWDEKKKTQIHNFYVIEEGACA
jgi:hypothetical protein